MQMNADMKPRGDLGLRVIRHNGQGPGTELTLGQVLEYGSPQAGLPAEVNTWRAANLPYILRGIRKQGTGRAVARRFGLPYFWSQLWLAKITPDGRRLELGLASIRLVTTAGVNFLVDALQGTVEPEILRFHGIGTGTNAEATGDTALQTELTTQYNPDNTRATGTLTEGASANIFRTVGTNTVDASAAVTEHGIFSQAATGGGTLLDRSVFSVVNLASADSLESTYDLTIAAGG
jgi:hypothetical protein